MLVRFIFFEREQSYHGQYRNPDGMYLTEVKQVEIGRTSAGKFDAETQALMERYLSDLEQGLTPEIQYVHPD